MENLTATEYVASLYTRLLESGDFRTNQWAFISSPLPSLTFISIYLLLLKMASNYFRNRKPFYLKPYVVSYNIAQVVFSAYMSKEFFLSAYLGNFSLKCQPIDLSYDPLSMRLASAFWWFYISKCTEVVDTFFIIVGKKQNQLTFLHVFHHATMIFNQWIATKYFAGGHGFLLGFLNASVHLVMYSYYCLACFPALRKYLWWKKYLTSLQLIQFGIVLLHTGLAVYIGCINPTWPAYYVMFYACVITALFLNFYVNTYNVKKASATNGVSLQNVHAISHHKEA